MAWIQGEEHCGIGPVFLENEDPLTLEILFDMVHTSLMCKFKIVQSGNLWEEQPVLAIQSDLLDMNVATALQYYLGLKWKNNESYAGKGIDRQNLVIHKY